MVCTLQKQKDFLSYFTETKKILKKIEETIRWSKTTYGPLLYVQNGTKKGSKFLRSVTDIFF